MKNFFIVVFLINLSCSSEKNTEAGCTINGDKITGKNEGLFKSVINDYNNSVLELNDNLPNLVIVGSSTAYLWYDSKTISDKYNIINRGLPSGVSHDVYNWSNDLIYKYNPEILIIYGADNDIGFGDSPELAFLNMRCLITAIQSAQPSIKCIYLLTPKPSPIRKENFYKYAQYIDLIKQKINNPKVKVVDIWNLFLDGNNNPNLVYFRNDLLHLNTAGYNKLNVFLNSIIQ